MIGPIDLHTHSTCSDGTFSPTELIDYAAKQGLTAIALTDHDTLEGIPEAAEAAKRSGVELIAGIEFSTVFHNRDLHILGLEMDCQNPRLREEILRVQTERRRRNQQMIDRMAADGIDISARQMAETYGDRLWTRAHFARYLADHGYVKTMKDAFQTHIGEHCKYYVPRDRVSPFQMVSLIRETGGIPVLAHPFQYRLETEELKQLLLALKEKGLIGVEAIYSTHTAGQERQIRRLAEETGLQISGGSDFHGANKPDIDLGRGKGNLRIPYEILENLREVRDAVDTRA